MGNLLEISAIVIATVTVMGWWLRSRLEASIRHEYDKLILSLQAQQKRNDALHAERLSAFKALSKKLQEVRRYCRARSAEFRNESEFEPRTESLRKEERKSLLLHGDDLGRLLDGVELFVSSSTRSAFDRLFAQLNLGYHLELALVGNKSPDELNPASLYDSVESRINGVLDGLYGDLGFEVEPPDEGRESTST